MTETRTRPPKSKNQPRPTKRLLANNPKHGAPAIANGGPRHVGKATEDGGPRHAGKATEDGGPSRAGKATEDGGPRRVEMATRDDGPRRVGTETVLNGLMLDVVEVVPEDNEARNGDQGAPIHCSRSLTATATEASRQKKSTTSPKH